MFFCCRRDDFETGMAATNNVSGAFTKNRTSIPMVDFDSSPGLPVAPLQAYRAQSYQPGIPASYGKFSPVDFKHGGPPLSPAYSLDPTYLISPEDQFEDASEGSDWTGSTLTDVSRSLKGSQVGRSRKVHFDEASCSSKGSRPVSITVSSNSSSTTVIEIPSDVQVAHINEVSSASLTSRNTSQFSSLGGYSDPSVNTFKGLASPGEDFTIPLQCSKEYQSGRSNPLSPPRQIVPPSYDVAVLPEYPVISSTEALNFSSLIPLNSSTGENKKPFKQFSSTAPDSKPVTWNSMTGNVGSSIGTPPLLRKTGSVGKKVQQSFSGKGKFLTSVSKHS